LDYISVADNMDLASASLIYSALKCDTFSVTTKNNGRDAAQGHWGHQFW